MKHNKSIIEVPPSAPQDYLIVGHGFSVLDPCLWFIFAPYQWLDVQPIVVIVKAPWLTSLILDDHFVQDQTCCHDLPQ